MSTHGWNSQCPCCGFLGASFSSYDPIHYEGFCPICGYEICTAEKVPSPNDIDSAKLVIKDMNKAKIDKLVEYLHDRKIPLVTYLRNSGFSEKSIE